MSLLVNDRWRVVVTFPENAAYECSFLAWRDLFGNWRKDMTKKLDAGLDIGLELDGGAPAGRGRPRRGGRGAPRRQRALPDLSLKRDKAPPRQDARFALLGDARVARR